MCVIETWFESVDSLVLAQSTNSLLSSAQLVVVYWKHLVLDTLCLPEYFRWRGVMVIRGAKMFESILSTVNCLSRENNCNGSPEWINGKEHYILLLLRFILCGDSALIFVIKLLAP